MSCRIPQRLGVILCLCGVIFASQAAGVWLDVPFIKQEKDGCGAASIAMVMQYWQKRGGNGNAADAAEIQRELYSRKAHGIYAADMEHYFQQKGFQTFTFAGTWDDLKQHVEKGRPLIAALKPSPGQNALHYVVVVGVDPQQNVVLLNDAAQRKLLKEDREVFEIEWSAVKRWTLLAVPQSQKQ